MMYSNRTLRNNSDRTSSHVYDNEYNGLGSEPIYAGYVTTNYNSTQLTNDPSIRRRSSQLGNDPSRRLSSQLMNDSTYGSSYGNNPLPLPPRSYYYTNPNGRTNFSHGPSPSSAVYVDTTPPIPIPTSTRHVPTLRRKSQRNYSLPGSVSHYATPGGQQPIYGYSNVLPSGDHSSINQYSTSQPSSGHYTLDSSSGYYTNGPSNSYSIRDPIYGNLPPPPTQFQNPTTSAHNSSYRSQSITPAHNSYRSQSITPGHTYVTKSQVAAPVHRNSYVTTSQPNTPGHPLKRDRHSISGMPYSQSFIGGRQNLNEHQVDNGRSLYGNDQSLYTNDQSLYSNDQSLYTNDQSLYSNDQPLYSNGQGLISGQSTTALIQRSPSNDRISTSPSTSSTSAGSVTRGSLSCPPPLQRIQPDGATNNTLVSSVNRSASSASQRKEPINSSSKSINKLISQGIVNHGLINKLSGSRDSGLDADESADQRIQSTDSDLDRVLSLEKSSDKSKEKPRDKSMEKYNARLISEEKAKDRSLRGTAIKGGRKARRVLFALDRDRSEISCFMKYLIFGINSIVLIIGLTLTSVGFWAWKEKDYGLSNLSLDPAFALIMFGLICACVGGMGSIGALRENTTLLGGYAIFLTILLVTELLGGILAFVFKDWIKSQATTGFQAFIVYYRDDPDRQNLVDWIQESWLECCGLEGPKDWDMNIYFNCSSEAKGSREACGVPFSCCKSDSSDDAIFRNNQCGYDVRKPEFLGDKSLIIHEKGCLRSGEEWIESNLVSISVSTVIISIIQKNAMMKINRIGCLQSVGSWIRRRLIKIVFISLSVPFVEIMGICFAQNLRADIFSQRSKWRN